MAKSSLPDSSQVELPRLELQDVQPTFGASVDKPIDERRQQLEESGIDDTEIERTSRSARIEGTCSLRSDCIRDQDCPNGSLQLQRLGRRLHAQRDSHK